MTKKGAIGLSVNLLVVIIISLVILGLGIVFLYNLIGGAQDFKSELDSRTEAELERLLIDEGKQVALARNTVTLSPGETHTFGLGILNILSPDPNQDPPQFRITVTPSKYADETDTIQVIPQDTPNWLLYNSEPIFLAEYEHHSESILVSVPKEDAPKGTYIFDVQVFQDKFKQKQYDNTKKFTVKVK